MPRTVEVMLSNFGIVEPQVFESQIPGGMLSNRESQLKQQGADDRVEEVLAEVPWASQVAGYLPLVIPASQIVGTQAVLNVLMGVFKVNYNVRIGPHAHKVTVERI